MKSNWFDFVRSVTERELTPTFAGDSNISSTHDKFCPRDLSLSHVAYGVLSFQTYIVNVFLMQRKKGPYIIYVRL